MFRLNDTKSNHQVDQKGQNDDGDQDVAPTTGRGQKIPKIMTSLLVWSYILDCCIVFLTCEILYWGATTQFSNIFSDVYRYQCYATAFWQGTPALAKLPPEQCAFLRATTSSVFVGKLQAHHFPALLVHLVASQSTSLPLHTLPPEYPLLTLIPFSAVLFVAPQYYVIAFTFFMALIIACTYFLLKRYRSTSAAIAFAIFTMLGSWGTAELRFDPITGLLTLVAVMLAARSYWKWAYALIAIATLLKFYPVLLLLPLLVAQQQAHNNKKDAWNAWGRWSGLALFVVICAVVMACSLALNIAATLYPFSYFLLRPIQIESFPATLVWLGTHIGYMAQYPFSYGSQNIISALSSKIGVLSDILSLSGLLYVFWLQWHGKIDIFMSSLLTLLVVIGFGKVFSPQYLLWVAPFVAYVGKSNWKWLLCWGCIAALTTYIFPFMYTGLSHILADYPVIITRDLLIIGMTITLMVYFTRRKQNSVLASSTAQAYVPIGTSSNEDV
jgi:hypothetical protein